MRSLFRSTTHRFGRSPRWAVAGALLAAAVTYAAPGRASPQNPWEQEIHDHWNEIYTMRCWERPPPKVDWLRSRPLLNPLDCSLTTPKVAFVAFSNLPKMVQSGLNSVPSPELGLSDARPFSDRNTMLLYVPAPNADGRRIVELDGGPYTDLNPWCSTQFGNSRTSELCAAQQLDAKAGTWLVQSPDEHGIDLAQTSIMADTEGKGVLSLHHFRGIIVVANEIRLSGHIKTMGNDLVLVAESIFAAPDTMLDVSQPRMSYDVTQGQPLHAGRLLLFAKQLDFRRQDERVPEFVADGAFGSFPKATRQEWDPVTQVPVTVYQHPDCSNDDTRARSREKLLQVPLWEVRVQQRLPLRGREQREVLQHSRVGRS